MIDSFALRNSLRQQLNSLQAVLPEQAA